MPGRRCDFIFFILCILPKADNWEIEERIKKLQEEFDAANLNFQRLFFVPLYLFHFLCLLFLAVSMYFFIFNELVCCFRLKEEEHILSEKLSMTLNVIKEICLEVSLIFKLIT